MAHDNEFIVFSKALHKCPARVLEVGSKEYPAKGKREPQIYRKFCTARGAQEYVGLDLEAGDNVDVVGDLTAGLCGLAEESFGMILCCSVLEHVKRPWLIAANIERLLAPGGTLYVTVPWVWRFHAYPDDYWRISWAGIKLLFQGVRWQSPLYSTYVNGEFFNIAKDPDADARLAITLKGVRKYLPYLTTHMIGEKWPSPPTASC